MRPPHRPCQARASMAASKIRFFSKRNSNASRRRSPSSCRLLASSSSSSSTVVRIALSSARTAFCNTCHSAPTPASTSQLMALCEHRHKYCGLAIQSVLQSEVIGRPMSRCTATGPGPPTCRTRRSSCDSPGCLNPAAVALGPALSGGASRRRTAVRTPSSTPALVISACDAIHDGYRSFVIQPTAASQSLAFEKLSRQ